jgi:hypothetical protein
MQTNILGSKVTVSSQNLGGFPVMFYLALSVRLDRVMDTCEFTF